MLTKFFNKIFFVSWIGRGWSNETDSRIINPASTFWAIKFWHFINTETSSSPYRFLFSNFAHSFRQLCRLIWRANATSVEKLLGYGVTALTIVLGLMAWRVLSPPKVCDAANRIWFKASPADLAYFQLLPRLTFVPIIINVYLRDINKRATPCRSYTRGCMSVLTQRRSVRRDVIDINGFR